MYLWNRNDHLLCQSIFLRIFIVAEKAAFLIALLKNIPKSEKIDSGQEGFENCCQ